MKTVEMQMNALDMDLFVNMVNNDPAHIARAKAKRQRAKAAEAARRNRKPKMEPETAILGATTGVALWTIALMALV